MENTIIGGISAVIIVMIVIFVSTRQKNKKPTQIKNSGSRIRGNILEQDQTFRPMWRTKCN